MPLMGTHPTRRTVPHKENFQVSSEPTISVVYHTPLCTDKVGLKDIADNLAAGPVISFNSRGGVVTLESEDVTDALGFTPAATATTLAGYGITDGQQKITQAYSDSTSSGVALTVNTEYALNADATYTRPLPSAPNIGDRIVLNNFENTWLSGLFTLQRGNPSHKINNFSEDILFNTNNARRAELTYIHTNYWLLAFS